MKTLASMVLSVSMLFLFTACSDSGDQNTAAESTEQKGDHVWKEQVDAIDKAKSVEDTLLNAHKAEE